MSTSTSRLLNSLMQSLDKGDWFYVEHNINVINYYASQHNRKVSVDKQLLIEGVRSESPNAIPFYKVTIVK